MLRPDQPTTASTPKTSPELAPMMVNPLIPRHSFRFPRTRLDAIIDVRNRSRHRGSGPQRSNHRCGHRCALRCGLFRSDNIGLTSSHNATTLKPAPSRMRAHACARVHEDTPFCRCGVVPLSYPIERKGKKPTTQATTPLFCSVVAVVGSVVVWLNPLKSLEKGAF